MHFSGDRNVYMTTYISGNTAEANVCRVQKFMVRSTVFCSGKLASSNSFVVLLVCIVVTMELNTRHYFQRVPRIKEFVYGNYILSACISFMFALK